MTNLLLLVGRARSGKDSVADSLLSYGYTKIALADPIKDIVSLLFNLDRNKLEDQTFKMTPHPNLNTDMRLGERLLFRLTKFLGINYPNDLVTPREVFQRLGTDGFDHPKFDKILSTLRDPSNQLTLEHCIALVFDLNLTQLDTDPNYRYRCLPELNYNSIMDFIIRLRAGEGFRSIYSRTWIDKGLRTTRKLLAEGKKVIIKDVRLPDELEAFHKEGAVSIMIDRPSLNLEESLYRHVSEALDFGHLCHYRISNTGTLKELHQQALTIVDS